MYGITETHVIVDRTFLTHGNQLLVKNNVFDSRAVEDDMSKIELSVSLKTIGKGMSEALVMAFNWEDFSALLTNEFYSIA